LSIDFTELLKDKQKPIRAQDDLPRLATSLPPRE
jgi:hypothetical protein